MERSDAVPQEYASFLLRMWRETDPTAPDAGTEWRGEVEHIQSGRHWNFDTLDKVPGLLRQSAEEWQPG